MVKRRKRSKLLDSEFWLDVTIDRWDWDYSLSLAWQVDTGDPLDELRSPRLSGETSSPTNPKQIVRVDLAVVVSRQLRDGKRSALEIDKVGTLTRVRGGFEGAIALPDDALPMLLTMLAAEKFNAIRLACVKAGRQHSRILGYYFKSGRNADNDTTP